MTNSEQILRGKMKEKQKCVYLNNLPLTLS